MITDRPRPLPDCALCGTPTARRAHRQNRGMCTPCARAYAAQHPTADQLQLLLELEAPAPRPPDLSNVVVLDTRRRTR